MQPQNQTPSQPNPSQAQVPVNQPLTEPQLTVQATPVTASVPAPTSTTLQQQPQQQSSQVVTTSTPTVAPASVPSIEPSVGLAPESTNNSQQLPSVTPPSSPLATPPNIPPSELKEYLAKQANAEESNPAQPGDNSGFELMIVVLQFIMLAVLLLDFFSPLLFRSTTAMVVGAMLIGLGIALAIWARASFKQHMKIFPSPSDKGFLVTGGPYSLIRHPVYSGVLLACLGLVLIYPTVIKMIAFIALIFILMAKTKYEEKMLAKKYSGYSIYQEHTGKILPKISKS